MQLLLDLAAVALAAATFLQLAEPDVLLHGVWVILAVGAFLFGLRVAVVRIIAATVVVIVYAILADTGIVATRLELEALGVSEWPLMVAIALIVAVMADRVMTTGRRYVTLYRKASDQLLTAQEDERRRLARDLHDGVGQTLTALMLTIDAAEAVLWAGREEPPPLVKGALRRAQELAAVAMDETRDVSFRLRPSRLQEVGLPGALRELAAKAGIAVDVRLDPDAVRPGMLGLDREIEVYRIVQEALGNASRHSGSASATLTLEAQRAGLFVQVRDDGRGFDLAASTANGLGLAGMRERAAMLGAELVVRTRPSRGAVVELVIPWVDDRSAETVQVPVIPGPEVA